MTVFTVCKPKPGPQGNTYDVSPALEYGDIEFIFDAYENPSSNPRASIEKVRLKLRHFNPKTDYIITAGGDPYAAILVGYVLCEMNFPIKYLRFERLHSRVHDMQDGVDASPRKTGYYLPVEMPQSSYI